MKGFEIIPNSRQRESINISRDLLIKRGLLKFDQGELMLTKKGEIILRRAEIVDLKLKRPKRWDEKWRVLIFDIPERKKILREKVRAMLITIGFMRLQDSVWVYPYDCETLVKLLKIDLNICKEVIYMIVESIEYDKNLKKYFGV